MTAVTGASPYQTAVDPTIATVTASGGRTLTFAAGANTITASSGSFVSDGFVVGGIVYPDGTASNSTGGGFIISGVTATVITVTGGVVNEGPLSGGQTLQGTNKNRYLFGSELQNGRWGHYLQVSFGPSFPGQITFLWDSGPGLPNNFTEWGDDGITVLVKHGVHGTWGSGQTDVVFSAFKPSDGTTLVSSTTRSVTAADADYYTMRISKASLDAASFAPGDEIRLKLVATEQVAPSSGNFDYFRVGPISADF